MNTPLTTDKLTEWKLETLEMRRDETLVPSYYHPMNERFGLCVIDYLCMVENDMAGLPADVIKEQLTGLRSTLVDFYDWEDVN